MFSYVNKRMFFECLSSTKGNNIDVKGKWQQKFLSSHFKETPKLYTVDVYYRIFISALFHDIFWLEILSCPPILIIVDMHVTLESRNHIFLRNND